MFFEEEYIIGRSGDMEIIEGISMLDCTESSHVYLIQGKENILIDTGMPGLADKILKEIRAKGVEPKTIKHILLTHNDVDHVGNTKILQDITGATLWSSDEDAPYVLGDKNRPGIKRIMQALIKYEKPTINQKYSENQELADIKIIKTPGHTPGHVAIAYKEILFTGDMFRAISGKITKMQKRMNWNQAEYEKSLGILKQLQYQWFCPGHGTPIKRNDSWEAFINTL